MLLGIDSIGLKPLVYGVFVGLVLHCVARFLHVVAERWLSGCGYWWSRFRLERSGRQSVPCGGGIQGEPIGAGSFAGDAFNTTVVDASGIDVCALMET